MDEHAYTALDRRGGKRLQILPHTAVLHTNIAACWNGVSMEVLRHPPMETPEHCLPGYSLTLALGHVAAEWWDDGRHRSGQFDAGAFHLFAPYAPLRYVTRAQADFIQFVIPPAFLDRVTNESIHLRQTAFAPRYLAHDARISHIALALKAELEAGQPNDRLYGESLTTALAIHLLRYYLTDPHAPTHHEPRGGLPDATLRRVTDYLHICSDQNLTLTALAAVAGMSQHHFARLFRQSTGVTPHQYLIRCRVERAQALIRQGKRPLNQIAHEVGFADQSHLTRHFRRLVGTTPARFARLTRQ